MSGALGLKLIMRLEEHRGAGSGKLWLRGERNGRSFVVLDRGSGEWALFERVGHPEPEPASPASVARPRARARGPAPHRTLSDVERREKKSEVARANAVLKGLGVDPRSDLRDDEVGL